MGPPQFASAEESQRFDDTLAKCDSEVGFPTKLDYTVIELDIGMNEIDQTTMKLAGFAPLDAAYRECLGSIGVGNVEYPDGTIQFGSNTSGLSNHDADAKCRLPLYEQFVALAADSWTTWLRANAATLEELDRKWSALRQEFAQ